MLTDTHAHLDYPEFSADLDALLTRATDAGVTRILSIGTDLDSSKRAIHLAETYPQIYAVVGIHPSHAHEAPQDFEAELARLCTHPKVAAIGETGLDYHRLPSSTLRKGPESVVEALGASDTAHTGNEIRDEEIKALQAEVFRAHLDLAAEKKLNVVIHQRDSWADTLDILDDYVGRLRAVFHCFTGTAEEARELVARNFLVSFTGIVTFKSTHELRAVAAEVPAGSFMVETDCPYLAPEPFRGSRCEPAHTRLVAEKIAECRNLPLETLAAETERTAELFFRFSGAHPSG